MFSFLRGSPEAARLVVFSTLFFGGMWLSKTLHPVWFEMNGSLERFGVAYSTMALVGIASLLFGIWAERAGARRAIAIGCGLYSIGLAMRVVTDSMLVAVASGLVAGAGASTVLICLRVWAFQWDGIEQRTTVAALTNVSRAIGQTVATAGAGIGVVALGGQRDAYIVLLIVAAVLPALALLALPTIAEPVTGHASNPRIEAIGSLRRGPSALALSIIALNVLSGLSLSLVVPYLPILLTRAGLDIKYASLALAASALLTALIQPMLVRKASGVTKAVWLLGFGALQSASVLLLAPGHGALFIVGGVLLRGLAVGGGSLCQRAVELQIVPAHQATSIMGLAASAFLCGDMLGGVLAPWLIGLGQSKVVMIVAALDAAVALGFILFLTVFARQPTGRGD